MYVPYLLTARSLLGATLLWFTHSGLLAVADDSAPALSERTLRPADWWLQQAAQFCAEIEDADARSNAYCELAYKCGHANDLNLATAAATKVTQPQKGIYALTFVAQQYLKQGNKSDAVKLLKSARRLAEGHERELTNFGHAHLVPTLVEFGMADDAREYVGSIADPVQRKLASRELLAALAKHDLLDTQRTQLTLLQWSDVAYAYARDGRIKETLSAAERLAAEKGRDRAYAALVDALIERKRWSDVEPIVERLTSPFMKAQAQEKFLRTWAREQPVDVIKARLVQANSRAEKVALYGELIPKFAAAGRVEEAENAIQALVAEIQHSPRPAFVSKFGQFDDAVEIAKVKSSYLLTATALARQGNQAAAQERIKWAEEPILALGAEAGLGKMMVVAGLIRTKIDLGDLVGARAALKAVEPPFRGMPATQLAIAYAKAGDAAASLEVAREIHGDRKARGRLYGDVAAEFIRRGDIGTGQKLLAELDATPDDAEAYLDAAKAMIDSGNAVELQKWLADMPSAVDKAYACMGAGESLHKSGMP